MNEASGADPRAELERRIDVIEAGYEFMLAYAAQGRASDRPPGGGRSNVREHLANMEQALSGLGTIATDCVRERDADLAGTCAPFLRAVEEDAVRAQAVIRLAAAQPDLSSRLVDNVNASIHLRALLTDLFVLDEALKPAPAGG